MTSTRKGLVKGLPGRSCHMFTNSIVFKQEIYCSFSQMRSGWGDGGVKKLINFCGQLNCMVPNIKIYFDKKVMFLALLLAHF